VRYTGFPPRLSLRASSSPASLQDFGALVNSQVAEFVGDLTLIFRG
jgi:hypothetical protein